MVEFGFEVTSLQCPTNQRSVTLLKVCFIIYNENDSVLGSEGNCRISIQGPESCICNLWCSASLACHQHWPVVPQLLLSFCILATQARQELYHLFLAS